MKTQSDSVTRVATFAAMLFAATLFVPGMARAHCDTMNGPVVTAAVKALDAGDVRLVLVWVRPQDETVIRSAFQKTLVVRALGPEARALADRYFFETLVRIHRAGEGVPYTGLKPAETEVEPGIAAADHALEEGSDAHLLDELAGAIRSGIHEKFASVIARKGYAAGDLTAGRDYVRVYVEFIHYVERLHQSVSAPVHGHAPGEETPDEH